MTATVDHAAVLALAQPGGIVDADMHRRATNVHNASALQSPVDTGRLRASGFVTAVPEVPGAWDVVYPVDYAYWVDQGTSRMEGRPFLSGNLPVALQ